MDIVAVVLVIGLSISRGAVYTLYHSITTFGPLCCVRSAGHDQRPGFTGLMLQLYLIPPGGRLSSTVGSLRDHWSSDNIWPNNLRVGVKPMLEFAFIASWQAEYRASSSDCSQCETLTQATEIFFPHLQSRMPPEDLLANFSHVSAVSEAFFFECP